jgi:hypothetical protein
VALISLIVRVVGVPLLRCGAEQEIFTVTGIRERNAILISMRG